MDTFMDKLAQKLTAQEMIKANAAADAEELNRLRGQIEEYNACLTQMQEVNQELKAVNKQMTQLMEKTIVPQIEKLVESGVVTLKEAKVDGSEINRLVEEGIAKFHELQQSTEGLEQLQRQIDEKIEASTENVHKECVKVYRNVQAVLVEENGKQTESISSEINGLKGKCKSLLGISIAALILSLGSVVLQVLNLCNVF